MKSIYKTQFFRLYVSTGIDLTDATALKIIYKAPNSQTGEWTATLDSTDSTRLYYDSSALNQTGKWIVYAKATFTQGTIPGDAVGLLVVDEGKL
jgi:hypothetical protein